MAIDFLISVPFILGWFLCLLIYFRRQEPRQLFAAGLLLGAGLYGYVGAYLIVLGVLAFVWFASGFMSIYALCGGP